MEPLVKMAASDLGNGWASVAQDSLIKSHYQYLALHRSPPSWILSGFFTSQAYKVNGVNYRRPVSIRAWVSLTIPLARKWWRRLTK